MLEPVYHLTQAMDGLTTSRRDCVQNVSPATSLLCRYVLPSGEIMKKLLQLVWSLWEDPIDVRGIDTTPEMKTPLV